MDVSIVPDEHKLIIFVTEPNKKFWKILDNYDDYIIRIVKLSGDSIRLEVRNDVPDEFLNRINKLSYSFNVARSISLSKKIKVKRDVLLRLLRIGKGRR